MKLDEVLKVLEAGSFTCSTGAQLLAEQPTADEVEHSPTAVTVNLPVGA